MCSVCPRGTAINSRGNDAANNSAITSCTYCVRGYFAPSGIFTPGITACTPCTNGQSHGFFNLAVINSSAG